MKKFFNLKNIILILLILFILVIFANGLNFYEGYDSSIQNYSDNVNYHGAGVRKDMPKFINDMIPQGSKAKYKNGVAVNGYDADGIPIIEFKDGKPVIDYVNNNPIFGKVISDDNNNNDNNNNNEISFSTSQTKIEQYPF